MPAAWCSAQTAGNTAPMVYPPLTVRDGLGMDIPKPPAEHPRLFLTKAYLNTLGEKTEDSQTYNLWSKILENAKYQTTGVLNKNVKDNYDLKVRDAIEAKALIYVMSGKEEYGKDAINIVLNFITTVKLDPQLWDNTRRWGRVITTAAMVYDWCYNLLDASQRAKLIAGMENIAAQLEIKWPQLVQGSAVGHGTEAQLARDMLACGVATYDEKPEIYNLAAGRIISEFVPVRKYFYPSAYHHQGSAYGPYRYSWDLFTTFIFDRMGYPRIYGNDQPKVPYFWIYTRRPDGQLMRNGDDYNDFIKFGTYWYSTWIDNAYAGSYFKDPILMGQAYKDDQLGKGDEFIFDFLFYDTKVKIDTNRVKLPLSRFFPEPLGAMVARTGWTDGMNNNDAVAEMKIGGRDFGNHEHLDAGSFQIYCNGPLATPSGVYSGNNGQYGSDHFKNYYQRTIATNSMLIYDPDEETKFYNDKVLNDGGQRYPKQAEEPKNMAALMLDDYKIATVLAHHIGPDTLKPVYSYLKGDISKAYTKKVKSFNRSFLFINMMDKKYPAVVVVYDVVTSADKKFKKTWLLHSVLEPDVKGNQSTVKTTEKGYNGKLINTTLWPSADSVEIKKTGGASNAFTVGGKNFPQVPYNPDNTSPDGAMWRLEVSPKHEAETDRFLNVMQVSANDGGPRKPLAVERIETDQLAGAVIRDRVVMFSKTGGVLKGDLHINVPAGNENVQVFIADLQEGSWEVHATDGKLITTKSSKDQVIYFTAVPGKYLLKKVN